MRIEHFDDDTLIERLINMAIVQALHFKIGKHGTKMPVLEAYIALDKLAHDLEMKGVTEALKSTVLTLDSIELTLGACRLRVTAK